MQKLWEGYRSKGLLVIGVHTPETGSERDTERVRGALARMKLTFPVALDNNYSIWNAFGNRYWPTIYLIDRRGKIRFTQIGELHEGTREWQDLTRHVDALLAEVPPS